MARKFLLEPLNGSKLEAEPTIYATDESNKALAIINGYKDDRATAIVGGAMLEGAIDDALSAWMPGYKINDRRGVEAKVALLEASNLVGPGLLGMTRAVNRIRNVFAHQMDIATFDVAYKSSPIVRENLDILGKKSKDLFPNLEHPSLKSLYVFWAARCCMWLRQSAWYLRKLRCALDEGSFVADVCKPKDDAPPAIQTFSATLAKEKHKQ